MSDSDGLKSELERTRNRLDEATKDRDQLRRQLGDSQKMLHLACRDRDEARTVAAALIKDIRLTLLGSCPLDPLATYDTAFEHYPWLRTEPADRT
jgi:hypothetical protein